MSFVEHHKANPEMQPFAMTPEALLEALPVWPGNASHFSRLLMGAMATADGQQAA